MLRTAIIISSFILIAGCYSEEVLITEKCSPGTYGPDDNTILFFKSVKVFHESKGLARLPDGGPIDVLHYNVSLYSYDTISSNLKKITNLGELMGYPSQWKSRLSSGDQTISFSLQYLSPGLGTIAETSEFKPGIYYLFASDNELKRFSKEGTMADVSPDGKKICYLTENDSIDKIKIADLTTKKVRSIKTPDNLELAYLEWDKAGENLLLYAGYKNKEGFGVEKLNLMNEKISSTSLPYKMHWGQEVMISEVKRLTGEITYEDWGIDLSQIVPKSRKEYINDLVELKGNANYREAVLDKIKDELENDDIKDILKRIEKNKNRLDGYEKTKYEKNSRTLVKSLEGAAKD